MGGACTAGGALEAVAAAHAMVRGALRKAVHTMAAAVVDSIDALDDAVAHAKGVACWVGEVAVVCVSEDVAVGGAVGVAADERVRGVEMRGAAACGAAARARSEVACAAAVVGEEVAAGVLEELDVATGAADTVDTVAVAERDEAEAEVEPAVMATTADGEAATSTYLHTTRGLKNAKSTAKS